MKALCAAAGLHTRDYTVLSLPPEQVPEYLSSADVGLLPRITCTDTRVSSPIKFGEYLASGAPVILSDGIGDFSALVRQTGAGAVLPSDGLQRTTPQLARCFKPLVESYRRDPASARARCQQLARKHLDWAAHLPKVASIYAHLAAGI
jgi:glycosyltransferase involved in cell wall biosynthesis